MNKIDKLLVKLKIFDSDNTLSITSLMMLVLIFKVGMSPTIDWSIISALFLGLANYNGKKWFAKARLSKQLSDVSRMENLEKEVKYLTNATSFKSMGK